MPTEFDHQVGSNVHNWTPPKILADDRANADVRKTMVQQKTPKMVAESRKSVQIRPDEYPECTHKKAVTTADQNDFSVEFDTSDPEGLEISELAQFWAC